MVPAPTLGKVSTRMRGWSKNDFSELFPKFLQVLGKDRAPLAPGPADLLEEHPVLPSTNFFQPQGNIVHPQLPETRLGIFQPSGTAGLEPRCRRSSQWRSCAPQTGGWGSQPPPLAVLPRSAVRPQVQRRGR